MLDCSFDHSLHHSLPACWRRVFEPKWKLCAPFFPFQKKTFCSLLVICFLLFLSTLRTFSPPLSELFVQCIERRASRVSSLHAHVVAWFALIEHRAYYSHSHHSSMSVPGLRCTALQRSFWCQLVAVRRVPPSLPHIQHALHTAPCCQWR